MSYDDALYQVPISYHPGGNDGNDDLYQVPLSIPVSHGKLPQPGSELTQNVQTSGILQRHNVVQGDHRDSTVMSQGSSLDKLITVSVSDSITPKTDDHSTSQDSGDSLYQSPVSLLSSDRSSHTSDEAKSRHSKDVDGGEMNHPVDAKIDHSVHEPAQLYQVPSSFPALGPNEQEIISSCNNDMANNESENQLTYQVPATAPHSTVRTDSTSLVNSTNKPSNIASMSAKSELIPPPRALKVPSFRQRDRFSDTGGSSDTYDAPSDRAPSIAKNKFLTGSINSLPAVTQNQVSTQQPGSVTSLNTYQQHVAYSQNGNASRKGEFLQENPGNATPVLPGRDPTSDAFHRHQAHSSVQQRRLGPKEISHSLDNVLDDIAEDNATYSPGWTRPPRVEVHLTSMTPSPSSGMGPKFPIPGRYAILTDPPAIDIPRSKSSLGLSAVSPNPDPSRSPNPSQSVIYPFEGEPFQQVTQEKSRRKSLSKAGLPKVLSNSKSSVAKLAQRFLSQQTKQTKGRKSEPMNQNQGQDRASNLDKAAQSRPIFSGSSSNGIVYPKSTGGKLFSVPEARDIQPKVVEKEPSNSPYAEVSKIRVQNQATTKTSDTNTQYNGQNDNGSIKKSTTNPISTNMTSRKTDRIPSNTTSNRAVGQNIDAHNDDDDDDGDDYEYLFASSLASSQDIRMSRQSALDCLQETSTAAQMAAVSLCSLAKLPNWHEACILATQYPLFLRTTDALSTALEKFFNFASGVYINAVTADRRFAPATLNKPSATSNFNSNYLATQKLKASQETTRTLPRRLGHALKPIRTRKAALRELSSTLSAHDLSSLQPPPSSHTSQSIAVYNACTKIVDLASSLQSDIGTVTTLIQQNAAVLFTQSKGHQGTGIGDNVDMDGSFSRTPSMIRRVQSRPLPMPQTVAKGQILDAKSDENGFHGRQMDEKLAQHNDHYQQPQHQQQQCQVQQNKQLLEPNQNFKMGRHLNSHKDAIPVSNDLPYKASSASKPDSTTGVVFRNGSQAVQQNVATNNELLHESRYVESTFFDDYDFIEQLSQLDSPKLGSFAHGSSVTEHEKLNDNISTTPTFVEHKNNLDGSNNSTPNLHKSPSGEVDSISLISQNSKDNKVLPEQTPPMYQKGSLSPDDSELIKFYIPQFESHAQILSEAIDKFLRCVESGGGQNIKSNTSDQQQPKLFVNNSKYVILAAHKLMYLSDSLYKALDGSGDEGVQPGKYVSKDVLRTNLRSKSDALCSALHATVAATKHAATEYPSVDPVQAMIDAVIGLSKLSAQLKSLVISAV